MTFSFITKNSVLKIEEFLHFHVITWLNFDLEQSIFHQTIISPKDPFEVLRGQTHENRSRWWGIGVFVYIRGWNDSFRCLRWLKDLGISRIRLRTIDKHNIHRCSNIYWETSPDASVAWRVKLLDCPDEIGTVGNPVRNVLHLHSRRIKTHSATIDLQILNLEFAQIYKLGERNHSQKPSLGTSPFDKLSSSAVGRQPCSSKNKTRKLETNNNKHDKR